MAKIDILAGATSVSVNVFIRDSSSTTGGGLTGLVFNTASLTAYYALPRAAAVQITLATLAAVTSVYSSGGFKEIDATNMPGWYRLDIPDAALASGRFVDIHLKGATNMAPTPVEIALTGWNNQDAVRGGLTALPNANAAANGGLPILGANAFAISFTAGLTISSASGDALTLSSSGGNGNGVTVAGNGSGQGIKLTPGATGHGLYVLGGATSGSAARFEAVITPAQGIHVLGSGTGAGIQVDGGATGDGIKSTAGSGAVDLRANITGNITGNLSGSVGSVVATVAANLTQILGTALTETAGQLAGAFKKFFNIAAPASTMDALTLVATATTVTNRVTANTDQLAGQTVTAAAGVTFPTSVASPTNITAGTITTATNLTNAPTVGDFTATMKTSLNAATPASVVGAVGSVTGNVGGNVNGNVAGSVGSVTAAVTVGTNNDKTGYALSTGGVQAIWDVLTSALTTVGSIGKLLAALPGSIWDVVLSGHLTAGTTGAALNSAGSAGDPWATALPGVYASGSAGNIVGNRLDAAVSTRLATSGYTAPDNADITAIKAKTDNLPASPAATGAAMTLTAAYDAAKTAAQVSDIPTAIQNADALLKRDMSAVTGEAARSPLNALRFLRNKWTLVSTLLTVTKEDDTTTAWTATVGTTAGADPVTSTDPT